MRDVVLAPPDPAWAVLLEEESQRLTAALGACLAAVHHIGSTSISGIVAKPIVDLVAEMSDIASLEGRRLAIEALGYEWRGEYGLPGRRYCVKREPGTERRLVHLHCYAGDHADLKRLLAFRDYLRAYPTIAQAYGAEKERCRALHGNDRPAYQLCKSAWIDRTEAEALRWAAARPSSPSHRSRSAASK